MDARELSKSECYHRQPSVNMESLLSLLQSSQQIHHHQQQQQQLQQHHTQNPNQSQPELHRWFPSPLTYAQHAQQAVRAASHQNLAHTASHQFDQHQFPATRPQVQWNPANAYNQLQTAVQLMLQSRQCNESVARCTSQINHPNSHPSSIASRHLNTSQGSIVDEDVALASSKSCEKHELEEGDDANSNDQAISELLDEPAKEKSNPSQGSSCNGSRIRTAYNSMQILNLEREFGNNMYLTRIRRIELAQKLKLSEKQVKIWFQNRRVKYKKESVSHR